MTRPAPQTGLPWTTWAALDRVAPGSVDPVWSTLLEVWPEGEPVVAETAHRILELLAATEDPAARFERLTGCRLGANTADRAPQSETADEDPNKNA